MVLTLLTGCGATTDTSITKTTQKVKKTSVRKNDDDNTKVLVVYYSATGSTAAVAETIADSTGGDLFERILIVMMIWIGPTRAAEYLRRTTTLLLEMWNLPIIL